MICIKQYQDTRLDEVNSKGKILSALASSWQNKKSPPRLEGTKVFEGSPSVLISMNKQYVICIKNDNYKATLELRKVYQVVNDKQTPGGLLRVVDETGEDFLFPENLFVPISVPQAAENIFLESK